MDASAPSTIQPTPAWSFAGPTPADRALSAQLEAEVATASAAQARMELLSVKIAADGLPRQWPDAAYLQMDYSDQRHGALVPAAVLDANGEVLDDDTELWDELDNGADVPALIGNLSDDRGDWSAHRTFRNGQLCLDLKKAAAMTTKEIGSSAGVQEYSPFG